jgi:heme/copper-type cytochrome/quinol oxidase subunit 2
MVVLKRAMEMRLLRFLALSVVFATTSTSAGSTPTAQGPAPRVIEEHEVIELRVRSEDTNHGFRLVGTSTNLIVPKRGKGFVTATLSGLQPGRYTFECSRMCGAGHHFMRGSLTVRPAPGAAR